MLSLTHTLISLPFASYLDAPVLIFMSAFVFHFFADTLLHWNIYPDHFKRYPYGLIALDVAAGVVLSWLWLGSAVLSVPVVAAIAGGNAPDILQALWDKLPLSIRTNRFALPISRAARFHDRLQRETTNKLHGLAWQIVLIALAYITIRLG